MPRAAKTTNEETLKKATLELVDSALVLLLDLEMNKKTTIC
jgi:hypothetical protein